MSDNQPDEKSGSIPPLPSSGTVGLPKAPTRLLPGARKTSSGKVVVTLSSVAKPPPVTQTLQSPPPLPTPKPVEPAPATVVAPQPAAATPPSPSAPVTAPPKMIPTTTAPMAKGPPPLPPKQVAPAKPQTQVARAGGTTFVKLPPKTANPSLVTLSGKSASPAALASAPAPVAKTTDTPPSPAPSPPLIPPSKAGTPSTGVTPPPVMKPATTSKSGATPPPLPVKKSTQALSRKTGAHKIPPIKLNELAPEPSAEDSIFAPADTSKPAPAPAGWKTLETGELPPPQGGLVNLDVFERSQRIEPKPPAKPIPRAVPVVARDQPVAKDQPNDQPAAKPAETSAPATKPPQQPLTAPALRPPTQQLKVPSKRATGPIKLATPPPLPVVQAKAPSTPTVAPALRPPTGRVPIETPQPQPAKPETPPATAKPDAPAAVRPAAPAPATPLNKPVEGKRAAQISGPILSPLKPAPAPAPEKTAASTPPPATALAKPAAQAPPAAQPVEPASTLTKPPERKRAAQISGPILSPLKPASAKPPPLPTAHHAPVAPPLTSKAAEPPTEKLAAPVKIEASAPPIEAPKAPPLAAKAIEPPTEKLAAPVKIEASTPVVEAPKAPPLIEKSPEPVAEKLPQPHLPGEAPKTEPAPSATVKPAAAKPAGTPETRQAMSRTASLAKSATDWLKKTALIGPVTPKTLPPPVFESKAEPKPALKAPVLPKRVAAREADAATTPAAPEAPAPVTAKADAVSAPAPIPAPAETKEAPAVAPPKADVSPSAAPATKEPAPAEKKETPSASAPTVDKERKDEASAEKPKPAVEISLKSPAKSQKLPETMPAKWAAPLVPLAGAVEAAGLGGATKRDITAEPAKTTTTTKTPRKKATVPLTRAERAKRRRVMEMIFFWAICLPAAAALLAFGALHFGRDTRVEGQVIPPSGMALANEVWIVTDFSSYASGIAEDLAEERAPLEQEIAERQEHVRRAQADVAAREERIRLIRQQIDATKAEIAAIVKDSRDATQAIWNGEGAEIDNEYQQKMADLKKAIADRAASMHLNYAPDESFQSPEVWANAYRLALYQVPKGVDTVKEYQWLSDQMKTWRDFQKSCDDRKLKLRDQAAQIKQQPGPKIADLNTHIEDLQGRVDTTISEEEPLKAELQQAQADLVMAQAEDANLDDKYYKELYALPEPSIVNRIRIPVKPNGRFTWIDDNTFVEGEKEHHYWIFSRAYRADGRQYWALHEFKIAKNQTVELIFDPGGFISTKAILRPNLPPDEQEE